MKGLSQVQFFKAATALKDHGSEFMATCPTHTQAAETLSKVLDFKVSPVSIKRLQEVTGITWSSRKPAKENSVRGNSIRTVTKALFKLYTDLGHTIPDDLRQLHEVVTKK